ncbi:MULTISPECIES: ribonuclease J [unclassified Mycoplasma]|uniref:ribonuclease J n=1 Tax=unclassified Mycoplasma TaxID=2683645 RepID=UPI00211C312D|nr:MULTISPECIES: ribonuclease J [unclassified Mycoplasma]UUM19952.1 ribonuclease J [Mycoplasma sp. 1578d]UUM24933.1 ribonuclease J [Mycoplasma sp. 3686d]
MQQVNIFALGGQDENGKNCYVFEHNSNIFIVNSGVKIPINSSNGVDALIPDFSYLEKHKQKIKGVFITDIKNESFSALPWLVMKIPGIKIYTSAFNKIIIIDRLKKYKIDDKSYQIQVINSDLKFEDLTIRPIKVAGSIPESLGYNFITPTGSYLFMFNFIEGKLGLYGNLSFKELEKQLSNQTINALICDAGRSNGKGRAIERLELPSFIKEVFHKAGPEERIIVGAYDEDMVQLQQILNMALITKRPVCAYGKTYGQFIYLISKISKDFPLPEMFDYRQINKYKNSIVLVTGSIERLFLRFVRITAKRDVYLKLKSTDNVIMMAHPVNGLESFAAATLDEIAKITSKIYDISESQFYKHHPSKQDIANLVRALKPKYLLPAQGLYRYLVDVANFISSDENLSKHTKTIVLLNGRIAHFTDEKLFSQNGKISEIGDTIIDGFGIGDISSEVIAERESLGREGVIIVNLLYSPKQKRINSQLFIDYIGVIDDKDKPEINELIKSVLINVIETKEFTSLKDLNEKIRKAIRKKIYKITEKDPMVVLGINNI